MPTLKPLAVDVYIWSGVVPAPTLPDWVGEVAIGASGTLLFVRLSDERQAVMGNGWALLRYPDGAVGVLPPEELAARVDGLTPAATPAPTPVPTPAPAPKSTLPPQPYDPVDTFMQNGVEYVTYFASGPEWFGVKQTMPLADFKALNPAVVPDGVRLY